MSETYDLIAVVKAKTEEALRKINDFTKGVSSSTTEMSAFQKAGTIAAGVLMRDMVQGAMAAFSESIKLGASVETLKNSFYALAEAQGISDASLGDLRKAVRGTISDVDLLTAANTAMSFKIPITQFEQYAEAAVTVGRAVGIQGAQAVDNFTVALGRLSPRILDNLGIQLSLGEANMIYAQRLGKTVESLTESEKATAFQTVATERLTEQAAILTGTTSEAQIAQEAFTASMKNLKTAVGAALTPLGALGPILEAGMPMFGTFTAVLIPGLITKYGALGLATTTWGALTAAASKLVSASIYSIPIIGWIAAAIAAMIALHMAWKNNWFGIRDIVKNVSDAVMEKLGWLFEGVKGFTDNVKGALDWMGGVWSRFTGVLDEQLSAQKESLTQSYEAQVQTIKDNMATALAEVETKYGEMYDVAKTAHDKEKEEHVQFWIDQLTEQAEGFDKAVEKYQTHYNTKVGDTEAHYGDLTSKAKDHASEILSTTTTSYDEQLSKTTTFYDEMLAEQSAFLVAIREGRSRDLDDLELNFLLQKQALEQAVADQTMTQEEFEEKLSAIEKDYRDKREDVRDNYRIQELEAEAEFRTEEERINAERAEELKKIEAEKSDAITTIEENLKTKVEALEQAKADEVARINEERKTKIEEIRSDEADLEKEHADDMQTLENKKAADIAGIQTQADLDMRNAQKKLHGDLESAEETHKTKSMNTWKSLWTGLTNAFKGFTKWLIGGSAFPNMIAAIERKEKSHKTKSISTWSNMWSSIKSKTTSTMDSIKSKVTSAFNTLKSKTTTLKTQSINTWTGMWSSIKSKTTSTMSSIKTGITSALNILKSKVTTFKSQSISTWTSLWTSVKSKTISAMTNIKSNISTALTTLKSKFTTFKSKVTSAWSSMWSSLKSKCVSAMDGIKSKVSSVCNKLKNAIANLKKKLTGGSIWTDMMDEMVKQSESGVGDVLKTFGKLSPSITAAIQVAAQSDKTPIPTLGVTGAMPALAPAPQGGRQIVIHGPLLVIEGSADKATAEMALELMWKKIRKGT